MRIDTIFGEVNCLVLASYWAAGEEHFLYLPGDDSPGANVAIRDEVRTYRDLSLEHYQEVDGAFGSRIVVLEYAIDGDLLDAITEFAPGATDELWRRIRLDAATV